MNTVIKEMNTMTATLTSRLQALSDANEQIVLKMEKCVSNLYTL